MEKCRLTILDAIDFKMTVAKKAADHPINSDHEMFQRGYVRALLEVKRMLEEGQE